MTSLVLVIGTILLLATGADQAAAPALLFA
jgi:hypothetical protein